MRFAILTITVLALASTTPGCGGSGIDSGVPADRPVSELSPGEADQLCRAISSYVADNLSVSEQRRAECTISALGTATTASACQTAVAECIATPDPTPPVSIECTDIGTTACPATVGEIEACLEQRVDIYSGRMAEVQCSAAGNLETLTRLSPPIETPAACTSLPAGCEGLSS
jgi:hypothetical protein